MTKLTEAQRALLSRLGRGAGLSYSTITGSVWSSDGQFTIKVNTNTFNALTLRGLVEPIGAQGATTRYAITDAGRAALNESGPVEAGDIGHG